MTAEDQALLQKVETRIRQLLLEYAELRRENAALQAALTQKSDELKQMQETCTALQRDYADLKLARMIEVSNDDLEQAKARLSKLAREVNKCIALMSV